MMNNNDDGLLLQYCCYCCCNVGCVCSVSVPDNQPCLHSVSIDIYDLVLVLCIAFELSFSPFLLSSLFLFILL